MKQLKFLLGLCLLCLLSIAMTVPTNQPTWDGRPGITIVTNQIINNDWQLHSILSIFTPETCHYTLTKKEETMGSGELKCQSNSLSVNYFIYNLTYSGLKKISFPLKQEKVRCLLIFDTFIV